MYLSVSSLVLEVPQVALYLAGFSWHDSCSHRFAHLFVISCHRLSMFPHLKSMLAVLLDTRVTSYALRMGILCMMSWRLVGKRVTQGRFEMLLKRRLAKFKEEAQTCAVFVKETRATLWLVLGNIALRCITQVRLACGDYFFFFIQLVGP